MNNKFNETCTITSELTTEVNFNKNDIKEFELMSDTLSSINFEDKLTDGQYVAICYFATLHNVTPFEVVGIDGKEALEIYMRSLNDDVDVSVLKSKESDTSDATRKFREAGIKKASELVDK